MLSPSIRLCVAYKCWLRTYHKGGHANGLGISFTILITGFHSRRKMLPSEVKQQQMCGVSLSYLMSYLTVCQIDVIYPWHGGRTLLPSDIHTQHTHTKHVHHHGSILPSVHYSQFWHFLSAVLHFLNSEEIILALFPHHLPSIPAGKPQGDIIHHPPSITSANCCLRTKT